MVPLYDNLPYAGQTVAIVYVHTSRGTQAYHYGNVPRRELIVDDSRFTMTMAMGSTLDLHADRGPQYGWYNIFRPTTHHRDLLPRSSAFSARAHRQQAHNLRERAAWNRRKFLHGLRPTRAPARPSRPTHSYSIG